MKGAKAGQGAGESQGTFLDLRPLFVCGSRIRKILLYSYAMKNTDKRSDFVHIGNILDDVLKPYQSRPDFGLKEVWRLWDEAVGETIAQNARPAAFKGKILVVHVNSSTWIHQLQFLKSDMVTKLNAALGKPLIEEIKFKIGPLNR